MFGIGTRKARLHVDAFVNMLGEDENSWGRIFGTSMMFGIGTRKARLHVDAFVNMLGEDEHSWGLSHKGLLWHGGRNKQYIKPFRENIATSIGLFFDGVSGTLTYYKDGQCLGTAFTSLNE